MEFVNARNEWNIHHDIFLGGREAKKFYGPGEVKNSTCFARIIKKIYPPYRILINARLAPAIPRLVDKKIYKTKLQFSPWTLIVKKEKYYANEGYYMIDYRA